jgi:o-succinylbenzoate synthase
MQLKAYISKHKLIFNEPALTSRGAYTEKESWFIVLTDGQNSGIGECPLLKGLSADDSPDFEEKLLDICQQINEGEYSLELISRNFPAIGFGLESALIELKNNDEHILFPSEFTAGKAGIITNGLIWMGKEPYLREQIGKKIDKGFSCIKLKIGSIDWQTEKSIIAEIRRQFSANELSIRVDANGAFSPETAPKILNELAELNVHSIEQPIKAGQWEALASLCASTPIPIALDEELIGIREKNNKQKLLKIIQPQYIILKPSLLGGFTAAEEWIAFAESLNIGWWATSALESNVGLNAIAQWTFTKQNTLPQGLGTGLLFANNISSPLTMVGEKLYYDATKKWDKIKGL